MRNTLMVENGSRVLSDAGGPDVGVDAERTSLRLPRDLTIAEWQRLGERIAGLSDSSAWWIGDWLVFGQERFPDRYKRAMADTSLDYQTLRNYAWVARRFVPSRRRDALTFQHHMEVAALPETEQDHWLDFAARLRWSRNELRKQVRASREGAEEPDEAEVRLSVRIAQDRLERWEAAARKSSTSLTEWMGAVLDGAA
ncbi:LmbU family transcriptional regulator [Streptomyces sp. NPDC004783]|uniref:LmbU family transcriptional regulator n=1 Tax=unclassified Streptomyces TaxID=2593676 RepID=UPI0033B932C3